jgi:drug/metabolite transporter (DMT)-like permease
VGVAFAFGGERLAAGAGANRLVAQAACVSCVAVLAHFAIVRPLLALRVPTPVYGHAAGIAILTTVIPLFLLAQGIRRNGASRAAIVTSVGPVATMVLARIFLDESFGALQAIGTALVLLGVAQLGVAKEA